MSPLSCFRAAGPPKADEDWELGYPSRMSADSDADARAGGAAGAKDRPLRRNSHLFKDKRVLARPAAKDKLKKIINVKKNSSSAAAAADGKPSDADENPDHEFLALAKIYSEVGASADLARMSRSRESLSHLLPFIMNALLYGFRDHELAFGGSSNASASATGGRYAKKSSALKLRAHSSTDPRELSLNGTSHLVKAQCERELESFLHEQAMRSVYFALDCAWYLTTSLFTGPPSAYHHTMTLLLSMESVVTNFSVPGDLFKKADLYGGDGGDDNPSTSLSFRHGAAAAAAIGPPPPMLAELAGGGGGGGGGGGARAGVPPSPKRTSTGGLAGRPSPPPSPLGGAAGVPPAAPTPTAGGGGEIVAIGQGVREVNLDTTGDGERDLRIAFPSIKRSDEQKLRQWLGARSERANIFHAELDFIKCLTDISNGLFGIDREFRRDVLRRELEKLNSHIPKNVFIPTETRQHRILRIVPEDAHVFSTKERVPYLLVVEVEDLGPSPAPAVRDDRFGAGGGDGEKGRSGRKKGHGAGAAIGNGHSSIGTSASAVGAGGASPDVPGRGGPGAGTAAGAANSAGVGDQVEPAPNLPGDKFEFLPEMTTTDSATGIDVADVTVEPVSGGAGAAALTKRDSSFRVDTEYSEDRRPPDEELIRSLGEPWVEKSERIRKASPFGSNPNWRLISCIVKARDQLRQEMFAQHLIQEFHHIFRRAKLPLWLNPYNIVATSSEAGLIETLYDAKSIDSIKKSSPNVTTLQEYFIRRFGGRGSSAYKKAVKNFVQSMAGYSVVSYLLNIKDRHNGNLMIDAEGHLVHIDFGFLLSNSPGGNMEFERSPFKLTKEMAQVMGGPKSGAWKLFKKLSIQGYVEACRHVNKIMLMVDIAYPGNEKMPCFLQGREYVLSNLRERFGVDLTRKERAARMARLIDTAHGNWTTKAYDQFQRLSLGIAK